MHLGDFIKEYRQRHKLSMDKFADMSGLSKAYISMLEKNQNSRSKQPIVPSLETIRAVANTIGVDFNYIIDKIDPDTEVSLEEVKSLDTYTQNTINILSKVTEGGKKEISNFADYIYSNKDYHLPQPPLTLSEDYLETYTNARAAAGLGAYNSSYEDGSYIRVKLSDTSDYDAIVDVKGNSMEPTIKDGDVAFVDFSFDQKDGKVYVVQHEDDTYIKRCYFEKDKLTLKSDNPEYQDIVFQGLDEVRVIGKVTGWATPEK